MDNKHRKLFVIKQSKGVQIYAQNAPKYVWRLGPTRTRWGGAYALPRLHSKLTNRPGFSGTVPVWDTLTRNTPKCPSLAPDAPGGTELNPHNQLHCFVWPLLITVYCL